MDARVEDAVAQTEDDAAIQLVRMQCPVGLSPQLLSEAMLESGAMYVTVSDGDAGTDVEDPIFSVHTEGSPGIVHGRSWTETTQQLWSNSTLEVGFPLSADVEGTLLGAAAIAGLESLPRFSISHISSRDWVTEVQSVWPPIVLPGCLTIKFPWHDSADVEAAQSAAAADSTNIDSGISDLKGEEVVLTLSAGAGFGTGEHATTQMCCRALRRLLAPASLKHTATDGLGVTILDYGSGSGVLSFAALRFGAERAIAVEIDPGALASSIGNAKINGLADAFVAQGPEKEAENPQQYPIVVCNILAVTIIELSQLLASRVAPGGRLLLSGIYGAEQVSRVQAAFAETSMSPFDVVYQDNWALLEASRQA